MPEIKTVKESCVETMEIVFPNDANPLGNIFGGRVMQLIDIVGSISAMRHARNAVVTASMDHFEFQKSGFRWGNPDSLCLRKLCCTYFYGSWCKSHAEHPLTGERRHTSSAYLTYVSIDSSGKPVPIPPIVPESDEEKTTL